MSSPFTPCAMCGEKGFCGFHMSPQYWEAQREAHKPCIDTVNELRGALESMSTFLAATCLVMNDNEARALALAKVRAATKLIQDTAR